MKGERRKGEMKGERRRGRMEKKRRTGRRERKKKGEGGVGVGKRRSGEVISSVEW